MKAFFDDSVLLRNESARILFEKVKDLPIIDYHCHLNPQMIAEDRSFSDIGEFWLAGDHYKWRAMRMCGVDEHYITGDATFKEKFLAYARIMPKMIGNPLYYWTHMELKQIFGINRPLNAESAEEIYNEANRKLADLSVQKLLRFFGVERLATTDDPADTLEFHGKHGDTLVTPTFRPDQVYALSEAYLEKLAAAAEMEIGSLDDLLCALSSRLDFFVSKGCFIADHGFERFPTHYASRELAKQLFAKRGTWSEEEQDLFFGFLLTWLMKEYLYPHVPRIECRPSSIGTSAESDVCYHQYGDNQYYIGPDIHLWFRVGYPGSGHCYRHRPNRIAHLAIQDSDRQERIASLA